MCNSKIPFKEEPYVTPLYIPNPNTLENVRIIVIDNDEDDSEESENDDSD